MLKANRRMLRRDSCFFVFALAWCSISSSQVHAQNEVARSGPSSTEEDRASSDYASLISAGIAALDADRKWEARGHFERAHALQPSARTLRALGLTDLALEQYSKAKQELEASLIHRTLPLKDNQVQEAVGLLEWMRVSLAAIRWSYAPPSAQVRIDGIQVDGSDVVLEPGEHHMRVSAEGYIADERTFELTPSQLEPMHVALEAVKAPSQQTAAIVPAPVAVQVVIAHPVVQMPAAGSERTVSWPWWVGSAGVAALLGGGAMIAFGVNDFATVRNAPRGVQLAELQGPHDRAPWLQGIGIGVSVLGIAGLTVAAIGLTGLGTGHDKAVAINVAATPMDFQLKLTGQF